LLKQQTIGFKENKGQIIDQNGNHVKYLLNSAGLNVQLKKNGLYDVYETKRHPIKQRIEDEPL
jgi:hypothetical protein